MSSPFVAEIRILPYNFPPTGWATCNGQLMPISQNTALFSLLGTTYGGDGKSTFALPNLMDSAPIHPNYDPLQTGLTQRDLGEAAGEPFVTLLNTEMPIHTHTLGDSTKPATEAQPQDMYVGRASGVTLYDEASNGSPANLDFQSVAIQGGSQPHNNMQPSLVLQYCIALQGVFPARP
jgi:microcystin-dependent protein